MNYQTKIVKQNYREAYGVDWTLRINNILADYSVFFDSSLYENVIAQTVLIMSEPGMYSDMTHRSVYSLPISLPLDETNPTKTIETFFKLLMLQ